jgi:hypothetical protein
MPQTNPLEGPTQKQRHRMATPQNVTVIAAEQVRSCGSGVLHAAAAETVLKIMYLSQNTAISRNFQGYMQ